MNHQQGQEMTFTNGFFYPLAIGYTQCAGHLDHWLSRKSAQRGKTTTKKTTFASVGYVYLEGGWFGVGGQVVGVGWGLGGVNVKQYM